MGKNVTKEIAWKLFKRTGEIRYYMLYSSLKKGEHSIDDEL